MIGSTEFDYDAMTVTTDKESLVLPKKEFLLLYKLAARLSTLILLFVSTIFAESVFDNTILR